MTVNDTAVAAEPRCEARTGFTPGAFRFEPVPCNATRGLRSFTDAQGTVHRYCPAAGHAESVAIRFGSIHKVGRQMYEGME